MAQNPNTPPPNQTQNRHPMLGFIPYCGEFTTLLNQGNISPNIPNQPHFPQSSSPPIPFPQLHQSFDPHTRTFVPTFPQYQTNQQSQSSEQGGQAYSGSVPLFTARRPSLEEVNETQVEPSQPTKKKKGSRKKKTTSEPQEEPISWMEEELVALADAWCCTSQDECKGNDQDREGYWATIRKKFQHTLGKGPNYRSIDSLTSKWGQMKTKLTAFNGIYQKLENNPPSGMNEAGILSEAQELYKRSHKGSDFPHMNVWNRIRFEAKWMNVTKPKNLVSSGSKRSFGDSSMGSDARINIDLNSGSDAFPVDDEDVQEFDPRHHRPARGRDKARRMQNHSEKMDAKAKHPEMIEKSLAIHNASIEEKKACENDMKSGMKNLLNNKKSSTI